MLTRATLPSGGDHGLHSKPSGSKAAPCWFPPVRWLADYRKVCDPRNLQKKQRSVVHTRSPEQSDFRCHGIGIGPQSPTATGVLDEFTSGENGAPGTYRSYAANTDG